MLAVGDGLRADVEPVARGDGRRRTVLDIVVDGAGLDRDVVAIDAAGAEVVDRAGVDVGIAAVDQPRLVSVPAAVRLVVPALISPLAVLSMLPADTVSVSPAFSAD